MTKLDLDILLENVEHYFNVHNSDAVEISLERKNSGVGVCELKRLQHLADNDTFRVITEPAYGMNNEKGVVYHLTFRKEKNK